MKPGTPQYWLWEEIAKRFGKEAADILYQDFLAEMRRYNRKRTGSKLELNSPRRPNGRKAGNSN